MFKRRVRGISTPRETEHRKKERRTQCFNVLLAHARPRVNIFSVSESEQSQRLIITDVDVVVN